MTTLRIALLGYGKMGRAVEMEAVSRGHEVVARIDFDGLDAGLMELKRAEADVVIEFTRPEEAVSNFKKVLQLGIPLVTGTTGWLESLPEIEKLVTEHTGSFLYSTNFSPGVNIVFRMNEILAKLMNGQGGYDVYLEEAHHKHKKDAPSGTAISLLNDLILNLEGKQSWVYEGLAKREPLDSEISVAVTRAGNIVGKHAVVYRSEIDEIRLSHEAFSRRGFALGAVLAAEWIRDKRGFFNFTQIFT